MYVACVPTWPDYEELESGKYCDKTCQPHVKQLDGTDLPPGKCSTIYANAL